MFTDGKGNNLFSPNEKNVIFGKVELTNTSMPWKYNDVFIIVAGYSKSEDFKKHQRLFFKRIWSVLWSPSKYKIVLSNICLEALSSWVTGYWSSKTLNVSNPQF